MSLNKQIHIYSVDTSSFYDEPEEKLHKHLNKRYIHKKSLHKMFDDKKTSEEAKEKIQAHITLNNRKIKSLKEKLYQQFTEHKGIRTLNLNALNTKNIISVFESTLTRIMGVSENALTTNIIIVQTYFFEVIESLILDGFMLNGEKYVPLTASAGQIRTKKTVFIKESVFTECQMTLMGGLTLDSINTHGGMNVNKYLAYLALSNSATDLWEDFDITKSIVVNDMETNVHDTVDFIDDVTYQITRQEMDVPITHTDGCGMVLPSLSKKNMMVRLPWVKGLLISFPFDQFIKEANEKDPSVNHGLVTDIYGQEHDVLKEGIEVIFTESQFKMHKYYDSWKQYIDYYIQYNCQAGKCNEEEDIFNDAKINYQMLQTLTDMTNEELETIAKKSKENIINIGRDRKTMLRVLGVTKANIHKNYIQSGLEVYAELLNDTYSKEIIRQVKKSLVKESRAGKLDIDGKYTFICPDLYAFCEFLFLKEENPQGLLKNGEVFCDLYPTIDKLDCLRSPHLYREHAVRNNVIDDEKRKWFTTKGLYTSIHDMISKILMFDVDGDKSLVCADQTIVKVAERNMEGIVPLFYNMKKAPAENLNRHSIFRGLKAAYTGGNIGMYSNDISKIWNNENVNLEAIKLLVMENNFVIDMAKTLYKPTRPEDKKDMIKDYTKLKLPHFFIYAKDKDKNKVEKVNKSVVNRLEKIIPNPNINFKATDLGEFDYTKLKRGKKVVTDEAIINKYKELDLKKRFMDIQAPEDGSSDTIYIYKDIRNQILEVNSDIYYVVDVLVDYLYLKKNSSYKTTLWSSFGDILVENLKRNVSSTNTYCEKCGTLIEQKGKNHKHCPDCAKEIKREQNRLWKREHDKSRNLCKS